MARILLLEDDPVLGESLQDLLTRNGFETAWVTDGEAAADAAFDAPFDLYLFDINVPLLGGFDLLSALRDAEDRTPAIFISALRDIDSMTKGFAAGAEDYLKKPFDIDELLLRIKARTHQLERQLRYGEITFNPADGRVSKNNRSIDLGEIRTAIFRLLVTNVGQTIDKSELLELLEQPTDQALRFHISRLKQQLGIDITNVRGVGYRLESL
ncbi:response regulator transcription factor [Sulfurimonas sp. HSL-3221]|uniref:response regulator transcription factor n=1 Tax=Sulfurimonadaceae TaxID=2771471 RepID=UPI001E5C7548|nr:response regulator transcription factor [Sulfurimonas sp. HSL-3221]UFS62604.1 response regulator transcription factor [Sulfurimonas sp. HSL-3221]